MTSAAPRVLILTGPTGAGKSDLAVTLAEHLDPPADIINADSMQVYRGMDIGTAKPSASVRARVRHHLIDILNPDESFSAADFAARARAVIDAADARGTPVLVVGGAGFYVRSLIEGLFECPGADPAFRAELGKEMEDVAGGAERVYARLAAIDPDYARRIHPHDAYRIIRALEVHHVTGAAPTELSHTQAPAPALDYVYWVLAPPRERLYARIDARSRAMFADGLVDEVRTLHERGFGPALPSMQALGYRHADHVLSGQLSEADAMHLLARDTRRYAKRQLTWFRGEDHRRPGGVTWWTPDDVDSLITHARAFWDAHERRPGAGAGAVA